MSVCAGIPGLHSYPAGRYDDDGQNFRDAIAAAQKRAAAAEAYFQNECDALTELAATQSDLARVQRRLDELEALVKSFSGQMEHLSPKRSRQSRQQKQPD